MSNFIMSEYENKQVELIKEWEQQVPGVVSKGVGLLAKPAAWLVQKVVPQSAIKAALNAANGAGKKLADESDILRDGNVTTIEALRKLSLETSDRLANEGGVISLKMDVGLKSRHPAESPGQPGHVGAVVVAIEALVHQIIQGKRFAPCQRMILGEDDSHGLREQLLPADVLGLNGLR